MNEALERLGALESELASRPVVVGGTVPEESVASGGYRVVTIDFGVTFGELLSLTASIASSSGHNSPTRPTMTVYAKPGNASAVAIIANGTATAYKCGVSWTAVGYL